MSLVPIQKSKSATPELPAAAPTTTPQQPVQGATTSDPTKVAKYQQIQQISGILILELLTK